MLNRKLLDGIRGIIQQSPSLRKKRKALSCVIFLLLGQRINIRPGRWQVPSHHDRRCDA
jgi:hypothetical protein